MKVPVSWLRDYVDFDLPLAELTELMSMTGTKVEALHRRGVPAGLEFYKVGKVVTRDKHPDADRLSLCTVDSARASRDRSSVGLPTSPRAIPSRWRFRAPCCPMAPCCVKPSCAARSRTG